MMIHIFHGDDTFQSRRELTNALKDYPQVKHFEGKKIKPENLIQASSGLFSQGNTALVLEKFFSLSKKNLEKNLTYLDKLGGSVDFFIWEDKRLYNNKLNKIPGKKNARRFKLPNTIFKLLDSIGKSGPDQLLNYLYGSFKTHPPEIIFYLIEKRLRRMLLAKIDPEQLQIPGWQKKKLYNQIGNLSVNQISAWYIKTINIEWKNKTGRLGRKLEEELVNLMVLFGDEIN